MLALPRVRPPREYETAVFRVGREYLKLFLALYGRDGGVITRVSPTLPCDPNKLILWIYLPVQTCSSRLLYLRVYTDQSGRLRFFLRFTSSVTICNMFLLTTCSFLRPTEAKAPGSLVHYHPEELINCNRYLLGAVVLTTKGRSSSYSSLQTSPHWLKGPSLTIKAQHPPIVSPYYFFAGLRELHSHAIGAHPTLIGNARAY